MGMGTSRLGPLSSPSTLVCPLGARNLGHGDSAVDCPSEGLTSHYVLGGNLKQPQGSPFLPTHFQCIFPACYLIAKSCLTLCNPKDGSLPASSVHGIPQARTLEWGAIPFTRGSSQPRDRLGRHQGSPPRWC